MSSMLDALGVPPGGDPSAAMGPGPGGPPPGPPVGPAPSDEGPSDPTEILQGIIDGIKAYIDSEASDDIETQTAAKGLVIFQGLLADEQKNTEAAMGTTGAHKGMAKQINKIAGQVYGG